MNDYLFSVGKILFVEHNGGVKKLLVIGKKVCDEENNMHDYAGVPYPQGMNGTEIYYFEHREVIDVEAI